MNTIVKSDIEIRRLTTVSRALFPLFQEIGKTRLVDRTGLEVDKIVRKYMQKRGLSSALEGYKAYKFASSVSVNGTAVHGLPSQRRLHRGDMFTLDVAAISAGYVSDSAWSFLMPGASNRYMELYRRSWRAFRRLLIELRAGITLDQLARTATVIAQSESITIVPSLLGHGIGKEMHEAPVLTFVPTGGTAAKEIAIPAGAVVNIEPVFTDGSGVITKLDDGWALATRDGAPTVHFELSVLMTDSDVQILQYDRMSARKLPEEIPFGLIPG